MQTTPFEFIGKFGFRTGREFNKLDGTNYKMGTNKIRRLPVCDSNKKVIGILTLGDIAQNRTNLDDREICITFEDVCDRKKKKNAE